MSLSLDDLKYAFVKASVGGRISLKAIRKTVGKERRASGKSGRALWKGRGSYMVGVWIGQVWGCLLIQQFRDMMEALSEHRMFGLDKYDFHIPCRM